MLGNTRQDDLLNKLKSCIGSLKNENYNFNDAKGTQNYNKIKENYQHPSFINSNKHTQALNNIQLNIPNQRQPTRYPQNAKNYNTYAQPTIPSKRSSIVQPTQPYHGPSNFNKLEQQARSKPYSYNDEKSNPRRYEYGLANIPRQPHEEYPMQQGPIISKMSINQQQQIRGELSKRYSAVHRENEQSKYPEQLEKKVIPVRNYQQQVQQRRGFIEVDALEKRSKTPIVKREYGRGTVLKEPTTLQKQKQPSKPIFQEPLTSRKPQKALMVRQSLLKSYQQQQENSECSALTKLKKISELNQKINDRIRNIINVFEQHKC